MFSTLTHITAQPGDLDKSRQIVYKSSSLEPIANAYVEINKAISEISNHNLLGVTNYLIVYDITIKSIL
jgi:hypothetical protein